MSKTDFDNRTTGHDEWLTPLSLIMCLGIFDLDPCAPVVRPWPTARKHFDIIDDGLEQAWDGRVWCNPPYGRETGKWLEKCADHGNATAFVFARTETVCWQKYVWSRAHSIMFLFGRITFHTVDGLPGQSNSGAPSALISYNEYNTDAFYKSGLSGRVVELK